MVDGIVNIDDVLTDVSIAKPVVIEQLKNSSLKVVKLDGEYPFHLHDASDETFIILEGHLEMDRDGLPPITMKTGDVLTIPMGLKHRTRTIMPSKAILIGPK